jgi:hypothetical protein
MFLVQSRQLTAFEEAARAEFEDEMGAHCRALAPDRCRALGDARLALAIHRAVDAAAAQRFTERGPVRLHVELSLLFGSGFADDPQYPWAGAQLAREELVDQLLRAEALYERASAYLREVGEPDSASARAAWLHFATVVTDTKVELPEGLAIAIAIDPAAPEPAPEVVRALTAAALRAMEQAYPAKHAFTGREPLERLAARAVESAWATPGLRAARPLVLVALLRFAFGHRCEDDPFLPWIREALSAGARPEAEPLAVALEREAARWLRAASTRHLERADA